MGRAALCGPFRFCIKTFEPQAGTEALRTSAVFNRPALLFEIDVLDRIHGMTQEVGTHAAEFFHGIGGEKLQR